MYVYAYNSILTKTFGYVFKSRQPWKKKLMENGCYLLCLSRFSCDFIFFFQNNAGYPRDYYHYYYYPFCFGRRRRGVGQNVRTRRVSCRAHGQGTRYTV